MLVPAADWTPGHRIDLAAGEVLEVDPKLGIERCTVRAGVWMAPGSPRSWIHPSVRLVRPDGWPKGIGLVQCAAADAIIEPYEIDLGGVPQQGVQILRSGTSPAPTNVTVRNCLIHRNTLDPTDTNRVGYLHAIYAQSGSGHHLTNLWLKDIGSGYGLHFNSDEAAGVAIHDTVDVTDVTVERCLGSIVFWGQNVRGNRMSRILSLNPVIHGDVSAGGGTSQTKADVDYVQAPMPGYGYRGDVAGAVASIVGAEALLADALARLGATAVA